jgi:hypothetical protein
VQHKSCAWLDFSQAPEGTLAISKRHGISSDRSLTDLCRIIFGNPIRIWKINLGFPIDLTLITTNLILFV